MKDIETMTEAELDAELRALGVDPDKLIQNAFQKVCVVAREQAERIGTLKGVLRRILQDLPQKRDWLDPVVEREARAAVETEDE